MAGGHGRGDRLGRLRVRRDRRQPGDEPLVFDVEVVVVDHPAPECGGVERARGHVGDKAVREQRRPPFGRVRGQVLAGAGPGLLGDRVPPAQLLADADQDLVPVPPLGDGPLHRGAVRVPGEAGPHQRLDQPVPLRRALDPAVEDLVQLGPAVVEDAGERGPRQRGVALQVHASSAQKSPTGPFVRSGRPSNSRPEPSGVVRCGAATASVQPGGTAAPSGCGLPGRRARPDSCFAVPGQPLTMGSPAGCPVPAPVR